MYNDKLSKMWIALYILSILGTIIVAYKNCEDFLISGNCNCLSSRQENEISCPGNDDPDMVILYHKLLEAVTVQGMKDDFNYGNVTIPNINASTATMLKIMLCPYINISKVVENFQTKNLKIFKVEGSRSDENKMKIDGNDFKLLQNIDSLDISNFNSLTLEKDLLKYTTKLKSFSASRNSLNHIDYYFTNSSLNISYINLAGNQITSIPNNVFENVTQLDRLELWRNNITGLTKDAFRGLKLLTFLELSFNHIRQIDPDAFSMLRNLRILSLKMNNLKIIHKETFRNNQMLNKLRLDMNPDLELSDYLFSNLSNLQEINLSKCNIIYVPEYIFKGSFNILEIIATDNNIRRLPKDIFQDLRNLKNLDLSNNELESLPQFLTQNNLINLTLSNNRLKLIQSETFRGLSKLNSLKLNHNKIVEIDQNTFFGLVKLTFLDLSFNIVAFASNEFITTPFKECVSLKELRLNHNKIETLPDEIFELMELQYLNLSFNPIGGLVQIHPFAKSLNGLTVDLSNTRINLLDFGNSKRHLEETYSPVESLARTNIRENESNPVPTTLLLNNTEIACNCSNYGLLLYNAGHFPYLQKYLRIDQTGSKCTNIEKKPQDLEPGYCVYSMDKICPEKCSCNYRPYNRTFNIDCSHRNLTGFPKLNMALISANYRYNQTTADLSENFLTSGLDDSYHNVTILNLANNSIGDISYLPPHIQEIYLHNNQFKHLRTSFLDKLTNASELRKITLKANPWVCDCNSRNLQGFLQRFYYKVDVGEVRCVKDNALLSKAADLCQQSPLLSVILPLCLGFLLILSIAFALYYRYEQNILRYLFLKGWLLWCLPKQQDLDKVYDAFISFSHEDTEFVEKDLLPNLEPTFKVCMHLRDWEPGEYIQNHVVKSVKDSRRTIVVLTNDFLNSSWGKFEFKIAHIEAVNDGVPRVIMIIKDKINEDNLDEEMKSYLTSCTYVTWGEKNFWDKLIYAIKKAPKPIFKKNRKAKRKLENIMIKIDGKFENVASNKLTPSLNLEPVLLKPKQIEGEEPLFNKNKI